MRTQKMSRPISRIPSPSRANSSAATGPDDPRPFAAFQNEIYLAGLAGERPSLPLTPRGLEDRAREVLSPEAFDFVAGGAGTEATMAANRAALDRRRLVPRHLRGVAGREMATEVLGTPLPAPFMLAPLGVMGIVHPDGDLAVAAASAATRVPFILSTVSSRTLESVADTAGDAPRWFQLYWPRDPELCRSLVQRAEAAGYAAIVITVDTWLLAWRPRDLEHAYLPFLRGEGLANYLSDPVFRSSLPAPPEEDVRPAIARFIEVFGNPDLTWPDIASLRGMTRLPILVKGILHPDDARRAVEGGADGLIVSNHGGRQVDGSIGTLDALPGVVAAVDGRLPVLFDGGIRGAADILKALALGARAALLGRPYAYALAIGGSAAVTALLRAFLADLEVTSALCGLRSPLDASPDLLAD